MLFVQAFSVMVFMDSIFHVLLVGTVKVDGAFTVNEPLLPELVDPAITIELEIT